MLLSSMPRLGSQSDCPGPGKGDFPLQLISISEERKRTNQFFGVLLAIIRAVIDIAATVATTPASLAVSLQRAQQVLSYMQNITTDGEEQVKINQQILARLQALEASRLARRTSIALWTRSSLTCD